MLVLVDTVDGVYGSIILWEKSMGLVGQEKMVWHHDVDFTDHHRPGGFCVSNRKNLSTNITASAPLNNARRIL
jgi:hypothetical protein